MYMCVCVYVCVSVCVCVCFVLACPLQMLIKSLCHIVTLSSSHNLVIES